jgi:hypothetical protein
VALVVGTVTAILASLISASISAWVALTVQQGSEELARDLYESEVVQDAPIVQVEEQSREVEVEADGGRIRLALLVGNYGQSAARGCRLVEAQGRGYRYYRNGETFDLEPGGRIEMEYVVEAAQLPWVETPESSGYVEFLDLAADCASYGTISRPAGIWIPEELLTALPPPPD